MRWVGGWRHVVGDSVRRWLVLRVDLVVARVAPIVAGRAVGVGHVLVVGLLVGRRRAAAPGVVEVVLVAHGHVVDEEARGARLGLDVEDERARVRPQGFPRDPSRRMV